MSADQHTPHPSAPPGVTPEQDSASAGIQGGNRAASITPEGQGLNQSQTEEQRVHAVPKTRGHTGNVWSQDYEPKARSEERGGYGILDRDGSNACDGSNELEMFAIELVARQSAVEIQHAELSIKHDQRHAHH